MSAAAPTPARWERLAWVSASLVLALGLSSCGGGDSAANGETPAAINLAASTPTANAAVIAITKISEARVSRTVYDYVFQVSVRNGSTAMTGVIAQLTTVGQGTVIRDGTVAVGDMAAGALVTPANDTITLRHDRTYAFNQGALVWSVIGIPAEPPLVAGAFLVRPPMPVAIVNQAYSSSINVTTRDSRNIIVGLQATNLSPGGSTVLINAQGELTWTPNLADFTESRGIRITALQKDGLSTVFDVPISVAQLRPIAEIALNGPGRYFDVNSRYLIDVAATLPSSPVVGTLYIAEKYINTGAFSYLITTTSSNAKLTVITAPIGQPESQASTGSPQLAASIRLAQQSPRAVALAAVPGFSMGTLYQIHGTAYIGRDNVYSTRDSLLPADPLSCAALGSTFATANSTICYQTIGQNSKANHVVGQVDASCDVPASPNSCTGSRYSKAPVILVHGFTQEDTAVLFGLGGGTGTWGALAKELDAQDHPVFELRYYSQMRFEEVAGQLARLVKRVTDTTGKKPYIVAHSFGGIVSHLALAGKGKLWNEAQGQWAARSMGTPTNPSVSGLITLDSPLSGIKDNNDTTLPELVSGRDLRWREGTINTCRSIQCREAGASDADMDQASLALFSRIDPGYVPSIGRAITAISNEWRILAGEKSGTSMFGLDPANVHTVVGVNNPSVGMGQQKLLGDGLISLAGQAVLAKDFICYSPGVFIEGADYNFSSCINTGTGDNEFLAKLVKISTAPQPTLFSWTKSGQASRNYYFASRALHTKLHGFYFPGDFGIAFYPDGGAVHRVVPSTGESSQDVHPLKYFIDGVLAGTPSASPPQTGTLVRGTVGTTTPQFVYADFVKVGDYLPSGTVLPVPVFADRTFSIDGPALIRQNLGDDTDVSSYRIRITVGTGVSERPNQYLSGPLSNSPTTFDFGLLAPQPPFNYPTTCKGQSTVLGGWTRFGTATYDAATNTYKVGDTRANDLNDLDGDCNQESMLQTVQDRDWLVYNRSTTGDIDYSAYACIPYSPISSHGIGLFVTNPAYTGLPGGRQDVVLGGMAYFDYSWNRPGQLIYVFGTDGTNGVVPGAVLSAKGFCGAYRMTRVGNLYSVYFNNTLIASRVGSTAAITPHVRAYDNVIEITPTVIFPN